MRKDVLQKLLMKHDNPRSKIVKDILDIFYKNTPHDVEITFDNIRDHFNKQQLESMDLFRLNKQKYSEIDLFHILITGKPLFEQKKEINKLVKTAITQSIKQKIEEGKKTQMENSSIPKAIINHSPDSIPDHVFHYVLSPFLDEKTLSILSSCSSSLHANIKNIEIWQDRFIALGVNERLMQEIIKSGVINNYKKLYHVLSIHCPREIIMTLSLWEILCLSGEFSAYEYARKQQRITQHTLGVSRRNALHYAAASGSAVAMNYAFRVLNIPPRSQDSRGRTALYYAARTGSVRAMRYAFDILGIPAFSQDDNGYTALHGAARSGSVDAMKYAFDVLKIPADAYCANMNATPLFYAIASDKIEAIEYAAGISKIPPINHLNKCGATLLHWAARHSSVRVCEYVANVLKIPLDAIDHYGATVFHYAAQSHSVEKMEYMRTASPISAYSLDHHKATVLHYAARAGCVETMKYAVEVLGIPVTSTTSNGATIWLDAAGSGSVEAMEYVLHLKKILIDSVDKNQLNVLHYVTFSGSPRAVRFVLKLIYESNLQINPLTQSYRGHDAFYFLDQSKNGDEIRRILRLTREKFFEELVLEEKMPVSETKLEPKEEARACQLTRAEVELQPSICKLM